MSTFLFFFPRVQLDSHSAYGEVVCVFFFLHVHVGVFETLYEPKIV